MPLGMEVGLGPSDIVLDGDPAPPIQRGTAALPNFFSPCLLRPNVCMDQDASWYADRSLLGEAIFSACHTNPNPTHLSPANKYLRSFEGTADPAHKKCAS